MPGTETESLKDRIERLMRIESAAKPRVYAELFFSTDIADLNYWLGLVLSAGIATLGLVLNSEAVVIGAMLISPLMGPIIAAGLALALADLYLGIRALFSLIASILAAVVFAAALVWLLPFQVPTAQILSRTQPNLLDLGVAILSGLAGSLIVARGGGGGGVTALPGVAIAVALMPPLCTVGFGVGAGFQRSIVGGASLLFLTNLAAIISSALLVFSLIRMDAPQVRAEIARSIGSEAARDRLYAIVIRVLPQRLLAEIGKWQWRILMPVVALGVLFVPLQRGLLEVKNEAVARGAIREAIGHLVRPGAIVTQQVDLGHNRIEIRLVVTQTVPPANVDEARLFVVKKTGKDVDLSVRRVAGEQELAMLREQLTRAAPPPPPQSLENMRADVLARMEKPLRVIWPSQNALLLGWELGFDPEGILVRIRYQAAQALEETTADVIQRYLRSQLGAAALRVELEFVPPPAPAKKPETPGSRKRRSR